MRLYYLSMPSGLEEDEENDDDDIRLGDLVISKPTAGFGGVVQFDIRNHSAGSSVTTVRILRTAVTGRVSRGITSAASAQGRVRNSIVLKPVLSIYGGYVPLSSR